MKSIFVVFAFFIFGILSFSQPAFSEHSDIVIQSKKSVYILEENAVLTVSVGESVGQPVKLWIESDSGTIVLGEFYPNVSSGVVEIEFPFYDPDWARGEEVLVFAEYHGKTENISLYTSNFGATVELDQKVYTWTDKVFITIVAPDHNFDGDLIDEIGNTDDDPIKVSTRGSDIDKYKLVETGTDTGIFTGEIILTGFTHDSDGDSTTGDSFGNDVVSTNPTGSGPTSGLLPADDDDGLTVSFEFSEDETVVGSALVRWNIGDIRWLETIYPASGTGVVRVIDPDMNLDPEAVDKFDVDVWSDFDAGGIDLTVTETNEATGIFEGTVLFTTDKQSSGHRLRIAEGDTVTAEYEDNTLPDPYTTADELDITVTADIVANIPSTLMTLENPRLVDAFGNSLDTVSVDQQVQISADITNQLPIEQEFAYAIKLYENNKPVESWITGSLSVGQSVAPALSWIPTQAGTYTIQVELWNNVNERKLLDEPQEISVTVSTTTKSNSTPKPTCGAGTELMNGICQVVETVIPEEETKSEPTPRTQPTCGAGTMLVNGICQNVPSPSGGDNTALIAVGVLGAIIAVGVVFISKKKKSRDHSESIKEAAEQKAAEQKAAEQKAAEQKAAEQKAAEQKAAEQKAAEQKAAEQKAAEQKAAEQKGSKQCNVCGTVIPQDTNVCPSCGDTYS